MKQQPAAITLRNVWKVFRKNKKDFTAVKDVSLAIPRGSIFGLLGPNGAGKTTTISMICTLLKPTRGSIVIDGLDVDREADAARRRIGLVFQETTLDLELTGWENLDFHARLFKIEDRERRIREALALVGLTNDKDLVCRQYSGGMKRRLEIARSIIHDPAFILLDEPTLGLDPVSRRDMWTYIKRLIEEKGVTVLLTTHYLEEAERLCSRIAIMDMGEIVAQGSPSELKSRISHDVVTITLKRPDDALAQRLRKLPAVKEVKAQGNELVLYVKDVDTSIVSLLQNFDHSQIASLQVKHPSLDDVFLHYAGRKYEAEGGAK